MVSTSSQTAANDCELPGTPYKHEQNQMQWNEVF